MNTRDLTGVAVNPPRDEERVPINIAPEARDRLRKLLFEPEMRAVGYSEFIQRACEAAEAEIAQARRRERED